MAKSKKRRFWYHYNIPESRRCNHTVLTIHWNDSCNPVNSIVCNVKSETHERKQQPHCVVRGWCDDVLFITQEGKTQAIVI